MADGLKLKIDIDLDTQQMLQKLNVMLSSLQKGLGKLGTDVKLIDIDTFNSQINKIDEAFNDTGVTVGGVTDEIDNLTHSTDNAGTSATNFSKAFKFTQIAQSIQMVAQGLRQFTQPFMDFEASLTDMGALTGLAGKELDIFGQKARDLAKEFGGNATQQIESFKGILSKLGPDIAKSPEALERMSKAINTLSKASGLDAKTSMEALANASLQMGVDLSDPIQASKEMEKMMNVMAAGAKEGAAEIPDITEAVLQAGVAAKSSNLSFEEINAAIQVLAAGGKTGAEAGTSLRNAIVLLQKQTGPGADTLKQMGLTVEELGSTLNNQGLASALKLLQNGFNKFGTDAEKNAALFQLFGRENATAVGLLMQGADQMTELQGKVTGTGTAFEQASANMGTMESRLDRIKANIEDKFITIFDTLGSTVTTTIGTITELAPAMTTMTAMKAIIPEGAMDNIRKLPDIVNKALPSISGLSARILTIVPTFGLVGTAGSTAFGAVGAAGVASGTATATAWATALAPIMAVIATIGLLVAAFVHAYKNVESFRSFIDELWKIAEFAFTKIWDVIKKLGEAITSVGSLVFDILIVPFKVFFSVISAVASAVFGATKEFKISTTVIKVLADVFDFLNRVLISIKSTFDGLRAVVASVTESISGVVVKILKGDIVGAVQELAEGGVRAGKAFVDGYKKSVNEQALKPPVAEATKDSSSSATKQKIMRDNDDIAQQQQSMATATAKQQKSELEKAKEIYDQKKKDITVEYEKAKLAQEGLLISQKRGKNTYDELADNEKKLEQLQKEKQSYIDVYKLKMDADGKVVSTGIKVKPAEKQKILRDFNNEMNSIDQALQREISNKHKLQMQLEIDDEKIQEELDKKRIDDIKYSIKMGLATEEDLVKELTRQYDVVKSTIEEQEQALAVIQDQRIAKKGAGVVDYQLEAEYRSLTDKLDDIKAIEKTKREEIDDIRSRLRQKNLDDLRASNEAEIAIEEKKLDAVAKINKAIADTVDEAFTRRYTQDLDKGRESLQKKLDDELISEEEHKDLLKGLEEDHAKKMKMLRDATRGAELEAERQHTINLAEEKKRRLAMEMSLLDPEKDSEELARLQEKMTSYEKIIADAGTSIGLAAGVVGEGIGGIIAGAFAGSDEQVRDSARGMLSTVAGILRKQAEAAITSLVLGQLGLSSGAGLLALIAIPAIKALISSAIGAILNPILSSITSFSTGGRVDRPTLAVVGDASISRTGKDTEWIVRDIDIEAILNKALNRYSVQMANLMFNQPMSNYDPLALFYGDMLNSNIEKLSYDIRNLSGSKQIIGRMTAQEIIDAGQTASQLYDNEMLYMNGDISEEEYLSGLNRRTTYKSPEISIFKSSRSITPEKSLTMQHIANQVASANNRVIEDKLDKLIKVLQDKNFDVNIDSRTMTDEVNRENNRRKIRYS